MIDAARQLAHHLPDGDAPRRILVLGDAGAHMCRALVADGHDVTCCPDRQRGPDGEHGVLGPATISELVTSLDHWDLLVAVAGFSRIQEVHPAEMLSKLYDWTARHSTVALIEAPRRPLAPDLAELGPSELGDLRHSFRYVTELPSSGTPAARASRPVLVASNQHLLLSGEWVDAQMIASLSRHESGVSDAVSTFAVGRTLVKIESASEHYFERCQALQEAAFLESAPSDLRASLGLPSVSAIARGRAISVVVRELVPGSPLSPGSCAAAQPPIGRVIDACAQLAAHGLFHNDVRPWNLLWDGADVRLVDWADACDEDLDTRDIPQIVAFAGTVAALLNDQVPWGESFLSALNSAISGSGVLQRWSWGSLRGEPWLALPAAAGSLRAILDSTTREPEQVVATVIDVIMRAHEEAA